MIKNILIGTVLVLVMVAFAGATEVRVSPASQTIAAGDPFHVDVVVVDVDDLKGNAATLNFDPGAMQVTGITEGDFLKTGGSTIGIGNWDNTAGTAAFGYSLAGTWTAVSGSGTLATIEFDICPDAPAGVYDLSLTNVEIRDTNNELIPADIIFNDMVTILSPPTTATPTATPTATRTSTPDVSEKGVVVFGGTEEGVADTHVTDVIDSTPATTTPTTTTTPDTTTNVSVNATATTDTSPPTPSSVPGLNGTDMIAAGGILTILFAVRKRKRK